MTDPVRRPSFPPITLSGTTRREIEEALNTLRTEMERALHENYLKLSRQIDNG